MAQEDTDATEPPVLDMFDTEADNAESMVCRVCGSLVSASGPYPRAHWDWHETPNGA
ncbi:hypothetical protein [Nocardioides sp.]|uniref:hypothetical protein n=1 Tax=Nocardioides sp. TaxID=35761 RepID=UPI002629DD66|nr:hypothetical protein [Nocardioides sp.]